MFKPVLPLLLSVHSHAPVPVGADVEKHGCGTEARHHGQYDAPHFPILVNFRGSDEEFPLSGKAFVDANAHHYLAIEAAGGACAAVVQQLINLKNGDPPEYG